MGTHVPRESLLKTIKPLAPAKLYEDIKRVLYQGSPARLVGKSSHENFLQFKRYGNHPTITNNVDRTLTIINKEERNNFLFALPCWLSRFLPHLHLTPQGLVMIEGKKDRLVFDGSFKFAHDTESVNSWTHKQHEPPLVFPQSFVAHLQRIYNLRISYICQKRGTKI